MKYKVIIALGFWLSLLVISCNRDDLTFDSASQSLSFSTDTVFCDTVFAQARSETYAVKIYNNEDKDIKIPRIYLESGAGSLYRINVDGKPGTNFTNVPLRKKDSLYVFVEIAPVANAPEAIAEDRIQIESPARKQHVTLFSVVQDAQYFIQNKNNPNILTDNTTWTNDKVKVIFGNLTLAEGKTLNIEKGAKVYFHKNSGLTISKNSTLNVNGDLNSEVTFRGDRSDTKYDTIPVNWNTINFLDQAKLNMNYGKVFGGNSGLTFNNNTAVIKNSIIHTFLDYGIYAVNSNITAENLVMNNCGQADFGIFKGGIYNITHSTLAGYKNFDSGSLPFYSLSATNEFQNPAGGNQNGALTLNIRNSILYGDGNSSVFFKPISGQTFSYNILNSLLKFKDAASSGFAFTGNASIVNSLQNQDPKFQNYFTQKLNLRVKTDSPVRSKGNAAAAISVPLDIQKLARTTNPTLGAYQ
ncbi:hypothetical protein [Halpernia frigidisoli]|uniref:Right handed beta helix domain-containing protein n=1 Tax=Halpernia frigidisoli TaxID=1125876 RepID=A0A1I3J8Y2_9FLAO|nr:hypothetical protein [Halpernia frigidisoli]SFI56600.1 hypothetical protein SAMN05443292_2990 [Halpernia frigidisoli]